MAFAELFAGDSRPSPRRVTLRPAAPRDAELLWRWRGEWSVRQFQPLHELSVAQLRADLANQRMSDLYRGRGEKFQWIVAIDDEPVGWITLVVSNWEHGLAEVGYALGTEHQRAGVMTAALCQLVEDLFQNTEIERLEARCAADNVASRRVLEKSGFRHEGVLRGYFKLRGARVDNLLYAVLRSDRLS
jgi:RimJ/RimL family protein N-acetyltransferase